LVAELVSGGKAGGSPIKSEIEVEIQGWLREAEHKELGQTAGEEAGKKTHGPQA
jgi:hypothetical protein